MGGKKNSKEDINEEEITSAESDGSDSGEEEGEDYVVERVVDKKVDKNRKVRTFFILVIFLF